MIFKGKKYVILESKFAFKFEELKQHYTSKKESINESINIDNNETEKNNELWAMAKLYSTKVWASLEPNFSDTCIK